MQQWRIDLEERIKFNHFQLDSNINKNFDYLIQFQNKVVDDLEKKDDKI